MAHANYTVTVHTSTETTGDSVFTGTVPNTVTLVITPDAGYVASASDFSIGDPLPVEVSSVTFSDSTTAGQPGNVVNALVTLNGAFTMPSNDVILLVDIDGTVTSRVSTSTDVTVYVEDLIPDEGFTTAGSTVVTGGPGGHVTPLSSPAASAIWPHNIVTATAIEEGTSNPPGTYLTGGYFVDTVQGSGITAASTSDVSATNILNGLPGTQPNTYTSNHIQTAHQGSVTPNTTVTLFEKTFWTPPDECFVIKPFYFINSAATNSGYYTVEETADNIVLTKTIGAQGTQPTNKIQNIDTTDILPGMQLLTAANDATHTTISCAGTPGGLTTSGGANTTLCWPHFFADIRVAYVDTTNGWVYLTEKNTFANGDTLTFSSTSQLSGSGYSTDGTKVLCKKFTVKYNGSASVVSGDDHEIFFAAHSGNDTLSANPPSGKITSVDIDTSNVSPAGETRSLVVQTSSGLARFNILITDEEGKSYDFENNVFSNQGNNILTNQQADENTNIYRAFIKFPPAGSSNKLYNISVTPYQQATVAGVDFTSTFATGVSGTVPEITSYPLRDVKITSDAGSSGITIESDLTDKTVLNEAGASTVNQDIETSGDITKGGAIIYTSQEVISDFSGNDSNSMTSDVRASISGSGTATLTATVTGTIQTTPTVDTSITVNYGDYISQTPNAYDAEFVVSKSYLETHQRVVLRVNRTLETLATDVISPALSRQQEPSDVSGGIIGNDYDATFVAGTTLPATHKDFIIVDASTLTSGTLGSNGSFNDNFFYGNSGGTQGSSTEVDQIVYRCADVSKIVPGDYEETFTFKCNDGTTDSATKTATIKFTD